MLPAPPKNDFDSQSHIYGALKVLFTFKIINENKPANQLCVYIGPNLKRFSYWRKLTS